MSQYTDTYLRENTAQGIGNGVTVSTFLHRTLRGKAKSYGAGYQRALLRDIARRIKEGTAFEGKSVHNRTAYYNSPDES